MDAKDNPVIPVRAKAGYLEVTRKNKYGKEVAAKDHMVVSEGMHSAKEMEKIMVGIAHEQGISEDAIRIDTYKAGRAPIESNPRHRGSLPRISRNTEVKTPQPPGPYKPRRLFTGGTPRTPEEWQAHVDAFYARQQSG